jgi:hypothetical protein
VSIAFGAFTGLIASILCGFGHTIDAHQFTTIPGSRHVPTLVLWASLPVDPYHSKLAGIVVIMGKISLARCNLPIW